MKPTILANLALILVLLAIAGCSGPPSEPTTITPATAPSSRPAALATQTLTQPLPDTAVAPNQVQTPTATLALPSATTPATATAVPDASTPSPRARPTAPTATPNPDWIEYRNDLAGYRLFHPQEASVEELGPNYFPLDELPPGRTMDEYLEELQERYRGICVRVDYGLGYVYISAPLNREARYSPCGRTGVGVADIISRTLTLPIDGALYEVTEMEFIAPPDETLVDHSDYLRVWLDDGSRIEIGSVPSAASWQEYLASTREVLLQIVTSYQSPAGFAPGPTPQSPP